MDYKIVDKQSTKSLPYCEAGGKLELDNFGLLLSGDPDSDGGNDFAKSLLQGENEEDCARLNLDFAIWKYANNPVDISLEQDGIFWIPVQKKMGFYISKNSDCIIGKMQYLQPVLAMGRPRTQETMTACYATTH